MIKTQIYLEADQLTKLKKIAIRQSRPYAELVRQAVDLFLDSNRLVSDESNFSWEEFAKHNAANMGQINIDQELYGD